MMGRGGGGRSGTMVIQLISVRSVWNTDAGWELNQKGSQRVNPVHLHDAILVSAVIGSLVVVRWSGWVEGGGGVAWGAIGCRGTPMG